MADTSIEWTTKTWNPTTGCDQISAGCDNCYALTMAKRLKAMGQAKYQTDGDPRTSGPGFGLAVHPDTLGEPLRWRKPAKVFVNSMSDLFHKDVPDEFIAQVFGVMAATPQHTYQILTKRPARFRSWLRQCGEWEGWVTHNGKAPRGFNAGPESEHGIIVGYMPSTHTKHFGSRSKGGARSESKTVGSWPLANVWLGTSIESDEHVGRADHLRNTQAAVRFLSAEPLIGALTSLDLVGIDWLIIGGESGPGSRPMPLRWVDDLIDMARASGTAVFVKQLGTVWAGTGKGGDWDRWPAELRIREYPEVANQPSDIPELIPGAVLREPEGGDRT